MNTVGETHFKQVALISSLAVLWAVSTGAQETRPATTSVAPEAVSAASSSNQQSNSVSPGVAEVLKMVDAGVSSKIVVTFVESSPSGPPPTAADIIAMKEHKVPDEVVQLLLERGATARKEAAKAKNEAVMRVIESRRVASGGVDPESYNYFRAYYLQPRALASANQRLYPYFGPYRSRGFVNGPAFNPAFPVAGPRLYR